ncbi:hypothetical protein PanWU01x14_264750 [Parasponia andersonii]|uniref:Uncharacterized protein n=1 Tax=Parasponia andersonii TaxID=3476 RepID=A0A2P5B7B3_PARAD|nr:hypothetical protein PanWU01x14_264750 [Parasponia andersonii]
MGIWMGITFVTLVDKLYENRTPLCVSILLKLTPVGESCSQNTSFVPETSAEKINELKECFGEVAKTPGTTTGTSSSRVRRVRIVDNEAKQSAPLFSEGELPQGTPNNLSVGSSNSVKS